MNDFWSRVNSKCSTLGITKKEIATRLGVAYNSFINYQHLKRIPKTEDAVIIAQMLGTTVEFLVTGVEPPRTATSELQKAYQEADDTIKQIVRIALKLDQKQTEKREIV